MSSHLTPTIVFAIYVAAVRIGLNTMSEYTLKVCIELDVAPENVVVYWRCRPELDRAFEFTPQAFNFNWAFPAASKFTLPILKFNTVFEFTPLQYLYTLIPSITGEKKIRA